MIINLKERRLILAQRRTQYKVGWPHCSGAVWRHHSIAWHGFGSLGSRFSEGPIPENKVVSEWRYSTSIPGLYTVPATQHYDRLGIESLSCGSFGEVDSQSFKPQPKDWAFASSVNCVKNHPRKHSTGTWNQFWFLNFFSIVLHTSIAVSSTQLEDALLLGTVFYLPEY